MDVVRVDVVKSVSGEKGVNKDSTGLGSLSLSPQSQLLKKTSLLVDCLRDSGRHGNVMETLVSTAQVLPAPLMCEDSEGVEVMVEMWVRGKGELADRQPDSAAFQQWRERCVSGTVCKW